MALTQAEKRAVVAEVADVAGTAHSAVAAEYRGLSVEQLTQLRVKARENGVYVRVVKNSLARRAVEGTEFECMQERLAGPLMLGFSTEEFKVMVGAVAGETLEASEIGKLANLPTRDEAIAQLMSVMQAPVTKLARTMNEVPGKLVRTFEALRQQKDA